MSDREKIRTSIRAMVKDMIPIAIVWGIVKAVDNDYDYLVIEDSEGLEIENVLISINGTGIKVVPEIGSKVLVGFIDESNYNCMLLMAEKVERYFITLENGFKMCLNGDGTMTLNGDGFGGLIKVGELQSQLSKLSGRVDTIINAIKNSAVVAQDGGAVYKENMSLVLDLINDTEDFSNIENDKIKHG